jgi:hypothetical protein
MRSAGLSGGCPGLAHRTSRLGRRASHPGLSSTRFWSEDRHRNRDVRNAPIRFKGYRQGGWKVRRQWADPAVRERDMKWHVRVQLDAQTYEGVKAYFLNVATHRQGEFLAREFADLSLQPYRPVRGQLFQILRSVNRARHAAGYQRIPASVILFKRRIVKPFAAQEETPATADYGCGGATIDRNADGETTCTLG